MIKFALFLSIFASMIAACAFFECLKSNRTVLAIVNLIICSVNIFIMIDNFCRLFGV